MQVIVKGLCKCGCGQKTTIAERNEYRRGWVKGEPIDYIQGHSFYGKGIKCINWKGGRKKHSGGYILVKSEKHTRADRHGYVYEHILIVEKYLMREINKSEIVHHMDGDKTNNNIFNLMVFKTTSMHIQYHRRLKAYEKSGHFDWQKCCYCHNYDDPKNMYFAPGRNSGWHKECQKKYAAQKAISAAILEEVSNGKQ